MKESLHKILPGITILIFLLPAIILTIRKLWKVRFFMFFGIYGIMAAALNSLDLLPSPDFEIIERVNVFYNMIDIPFVMLMIYSVCRNEVVKKLIVFAVGIYIFLQLVFFFREGMKYDALKITLGYGLGIVLLSIIYTLLTFFRKMGLSGQQVAYVVILCALLFDYGSYIVIYIFDYYVEGYNIKDNLLIYYISSIISMLIGSSGMMLRGAKSKREFSLVNSGY